MHVLQASGMHCLLSLRIQEDWESAGFGDFTLQQSLEAISVKRSGKKHVINLIGNVDPLYWWDYVLKSVVIGPQRDPAWSAIGLRPLWLTMASSCGLWRFLFFGTVNKFCYSLSDSYHSLFLDRVQCKTGRCD